MRGDSAERFADAQTLPASRILGEREEIQIVVQSVPRLRVPYSAFSATVAAAEDHADESAGADRLQLPGDPAQRRIQLRVQRRAGNDCVSTVHEFLPVRVHRESPFGSRSASIRRSWLPSETPAILKKVR